LKYKLSEISIKLILKKQKEENHIGKSKWFMLYLCR
jgi:hypothetical protein